MIQSPPVVNAMDEQAILAAATRPTAEQLRRVAALRRFNRLYVYLPAGLLFFLALAGTAGLTYLVLARQEHRVTVSAVADALLICGIIPLMFLCAIVPAGFIFGTMAMRGQKRAPFVALQKKLWRLEGLIRQARSVVEKVGRRLSGPLIALEARIAYLTTWIGRIDDVVKRR